MKVKILLVDDHAMLRSGLRTVFAQQDNFELVGEASTGEMALAQAREKKPDVILMDVHLPDMNGIDVSGKILSEQSSAKIIVFSSEVSRTSVEKALQFGIAGYLSKTSPAEEIIHAVTSVVVGKLYISPEVSGEILKDYGGGTPGVTGKLPPVLTQRDRQLLSMISGGKRNKEIAAELDVSVKSVEAFRSRLMKKTGCLSSAELVRYAVREGIAPP
jgi:DNA-binding NarL/FixJ family response regulator